MQGLTRTKPSAGQLNLFYPIVPDDDWLARLVPLGVKTIQLRLKDASDAEIKRQISRSLDICAQAGCQLIVNDYWREAIDCGADYIHLGQEDLANADLDVIKSAGLRIGISTHDEEELATALAADPDYVALGPIYETKLKKMKWAPQGLARLNEWSARVSPLPLVAIGGLTPERASQAVAAGADSISVITDFYIHPEPEKRVAEWLQWAEATSERIASESPGN